MSIKVQLNGIAALKKFGVGDLLVDTLVKDGWMVKLTAKSFTFSKDFFNSEVPVNVGTLQALAAGTLGFKEKQAMADMLVSEIAKLLGGKTTVASSSLSSLPPILNLTKEPEKPVLPGGEANVLTVQSSPHIPVSTTSVVTPPEPKWAPVSPSIVKSGPPMKLRDAKNMYQPVQGSSTGSRYFVVAANDDLRVAARVQAEQLSVRIEGPNFSKHVKTISAVGFKTSGKDYASLHVHVGSNMELTRKTLGAILLGLGIPMETPLPDIKKIYP